MSDILVNAISVNNLTLHTRPHLCRPHLSQQSHTGQSVLALDPHLLDCQHSTTLHLSSPFLRFLFLHSQVIDVCSHIVNSHALDSPPFSSAR